jgi:hypothetical protein
LPVTAVESLGHVGDGGAGEAGGDHHPGHPGRDQLGDEVVQGDRPDGAFALELAHDLGVDVINYALVAVADEAPDQVGSHPPQADHSDLHRFLTFLSPCQQVVEGHPGGPQAVGAQGLEITVGLRRLQRREAERFSRYR